MGTPVMARNAAHLNADFSTLSGWQDWCRAQDGGYPSAKHDLRRGPEVMDGDCAGWGALALLSMAALIWAGMAWAVWRAFA